MDTWDDLKKRCIDALKDNPMFQLSLASRELFHSNFLMWIAQDEDLKPFFLNLLKKLCGDNFKLPDHYVCLREHKNFDFCIAELKEPKGQKIKRYVLVLENKVKRYFQNGLKNLHVMPYYNHIIY